MPDYAYATVDVFTERRFGGNPLAVFTDARGLDGATMQALAAEMNYSETTFVLPPDDPAHTARVRIFHRTAEMPFAGHPNVGTAWLLLALGLATGPVLRFEELAGLVETTRRADGAIEIAAPQPLSRGGALPPADIAACLSVAPDRIATRAHPPVTASVGVDFVLAEVEPGTLPLLAPDLAAFRRLAAGDAGERQSILAYEREADRIRARMFAPLTGTWEDPATGSANATLAALLLSLGPDPALSLDIVQGVEMGRPSALSARAWRAADGIRASIAGHCVPVFTGTIAL